MVTGSEYISNLLFRINSISDQISSTKQLVNLYKDQRNLYQGQLKDVKAELAYFNSLSLQMDSLEASLDTINSYFVYTSVTGTPTQKDFEAALTTHGATPNSTEQGGIYDILGFNEEILARLFQSAENSSPPAVAAEEAAYQVAAMNKSSSASNSTSSAQYGHISNVNLGAQYDLGNQLNASSAAGIACMEAIGNSIIAYITLLSQIEQVLGMANYINKGINTELEKLAELQTRNNDRITSTTQDEKELQVDYNNANSNYTTNKDLLSNLELDYNYLDTELNAATESMGGQPSISSGSGS